MQMAQVTDSLHEHFFRVEREVVFGPLTARFCTSPCLSGSFNRVSAQVSVSLVKPELLKVVAELFCDLRL